MRNLPKAGDSVQFTHSVVSNSLWLHGLQHVRLPYLSPTPRTCSNSCYQDSDAFQSSHPLLSPSPSAFTLSQHQGFFPMSQLFASGGQSIGASASVLPMNIQDWFPLGLTGLTSLLSWGLSAVASGVLAKFPVAELVQRWGTASVSTHFLIIDDNWERASIQQQQYQGLEMKTEAIASLLHSHLHHFPGSSKL